MAIADPRAFILANTRLQAVPHTPQIRLWLADEITPIWRMTEEELGELGLPPPFWAFAWSGGQGLARWLLDHPEEVAGRTVLDFATGSGLVGIAAALSAATTVRCVDIDPFCGAAVALNAAANDVAVEFTDTDLLDHDPPKVDVLCAGDVCYEKPMTDRVMAWLRQARRQGSRVLIGDPHRTYFDAAGLTLLAEYQVPTTRGLEDFAIKRSSVFALD
ncbi:nicotinamide N-methyase [Brevundimonas sp. LM2]|uniref:class I SAM-dependent methyltransferase n=1 Tax=Brevundimonas sp. LM2 TaxID=1938605 RepID=UPI000983CD5B|nr:methyltransferase [Brevundimonas sp. LM2]AQR62964.1 nicotinamide N-methyase [Brevundimonas sp. LM2]